MDKNPFSSWEIGIGKGAPFHIHLEEPRVIHNVADEDQVLSPEVVGPEFIRGAERNGLSALLRKPSLEARLFGFEARRNHDQKTGRVEGGFKNAAADLGREASRNISIVVFLLIPGRRQGDDGQKAQD